MLQRVRSSWCLLMSLALSQPCSSILLHAQSWFRLTQVDQKANQLAYHLIASGVSPGATVVLLMNRSADFIVSLLAVLKAGCAYSALSAELPEEALQHILQDSAPALVITHGGLHALLPKGADTLRVFNFDSAPDAKTLSKRLALC